MEILSATRWKYSASISTTRRFSDYSGFFPASRFSYFGLFLLVLGYFSLIIILGPFLVLVILGYIYQPMNPLLCVISCFWIISCLSLFFCFFFLLVQLENIRSFYAVNRRIFDENTSAEIKNLQSVKIYAFS